MYTYVHSSQDDANVIFQESYTQTSSGYSRKYLRVLESKEKTIKCTVYVVHHVGLRPHILVAERVRRSLCSFLTYWLRSTRKRFINLCISESTKGSQLFPLDLSKAIVHSNPQNIREWILLRRLEKLYSAKRAIWMDRCVWWQCWGRFSFSFRRQLPEDDPIAWVQPRIEQKAGLIEF